MGLLDTIIGAATREVHAPPYWFKIRRVDSAKVSLGAQMMTLIAVRSTSNTEDKRAIDAFLPAAEKELGEEADPVELRQLASQLHFVAGMRETDHVKLSRLRAGMICGGVVAIRATPEDDWEPCKIVPAGTPSSAAAGRLEVTDLPARTRNSLADEIYAFTKGGPEVQAVADSFPDGP